MVQTEFVEVVKTSEIPNWKMKRFEVDGKRSINCKHVKVWVAIIGFKNSRL